MKKTVITLSIMAACLSAFVFFAQRVTAATFPQMTLQLGHGSAPSDDDQYHKFATLFAEKVSKATEGAVKIDIYPSGQLGGEMDTLEGLGMGTIDMAVVTANVFGIIYKPSMIIDLPFVFKDAAAAHKFLDSDLEKEICSEISKVANLVVLGWGEGGFRNVLNNIRPIKTPADFANIKLRVPETPIFVNTFKSLGANATPMTYSETYTGLQQKTIDGIELPVVNTYTVHYYDVCKYMSMTGHFYNALSMCISKNKFDALSPELKEIFFKAAVEAGQEQRVFVGENEGRLLAKMKEAGLVINDDVDKAAMRAAVQPIYDEYQKNVSKETYEKAMKLLAEE